MNVPVVPPNQLDKGAQFIYKKYINIYQKYTMMSDD